MKRGLRLRLAVTHALVAAMAIAVVAAIVLVAGGRRFDSYLVLVQSGRNAAVVDGLTQAYRAPDGWDASAIYALSQVARMSNVDVAVYSPQGKLLFTVQGLHRGSGSAAAVSASPAARAATLDPVRFHLQSYPVIVGAEKVATAEVYAPRTARAEAESAFQNALTRDLVIAALVAAVLASLVSLLVSRRITSPLEELTDAAEDVVGGNLEVRVAPRGDDEVGALATAFNAMADRLASDEQWRRDMTADLSRELRTPLATIQTRIEALEDGVLSATPENLRVIGAEGER
ncbi:MAG TPA: HAMP domain-containing protein, partial [Thermoleophilia bacterium]